jgi:hypothetical protein
MMTDEKNRQLAEEFVAEIHIAVQAIRPDVTSYYDQWAMAEDVAFEMVILIRRNRRAADAWS